LRETTAMMTAAAVAAKPASGVKANIRCHHARGDPAKRAARRVLSAK